MLSSLDFDLAAGESGTLSGLAARKYTIEGYAPDDPSGMTYKQALVDMRDKLVTLSLHPENPSADVAGALLELTTVEAALQQMHGSQAFQSCSAAIKTGVDGKVTVSWNPSGLGNTGAWSLRLPVGQTCGVTARIARRRRAPVSARLRTMATSCPCDAEAFLLKRGSCDGWHSTELSWDPIPKRGDP